MWKRDHVLLRHINLSIFTFDMIFENDYFKKVSLNPLMPGGNKKVTYT